MSTKQDFENFRGRKQEVTLRDDFDAVIHYGRMTIELNKNGSAIFAFDQHGTVSVAGRSVPEIDSAVHTDKTRNTILDEAALIARHHHHATLTFDHLIAAIIRISPDELQAVLPAGITAKKIQGIVDRELLDDCRHARLLSSEDALKINDAACRAVEEGTSVTRYSWRTDQLLGVEILHAMLKSSFQSVSERSATLDYIGLVISDHLQKDAIAENRKAIRKYAASQGEVMDRRPGPSIRLNPAA